MNHNPDINDALGAHLGYAARAMKNALNRKFNRMGFNITFDQWHLLLFLWIADARPQKELAELCHKDKATLARLAGGLERRGLIRRSADPRDKRSRIVSLTDEGRELEQQLMPEAMEVMSRATDGISDEEVIVLKSLLIRVCDNLAKI
ncbi:MAG: MarR family winged helix-turn-helix transcriptional regulator [Candidatus Kapaibacterium sp.]